MCTRTIHQKLSALRTNNISHVASKHNSVRLEEEDGNEICTQRNASAPSLKMKFIKKTLMCQLSRV